MNRIALICFCTAVSAAVVQPARAQTPADTDRVVITAQRSSVDATRHDVVTVCPAIAEQLPEALASAWHHVGQEGTVRVQFTLQGQAVSAVQALSGPRRYGRWVRSAMFDVSCRADTAQTQTFEFDVRFVDPSTLRPGQTVAVLLR
jgi:hypothetical protein